MAELERRLDVQETVTLPQQTQEIATVSAIGSEGEFFMSLVHLSRAVTAGRPYATQLLALQTFYAEPAAVTGQINILKAWSEKGVPTDKDIVEALKLALPRVILAEENLLEIPWWQRFWASIRSLVTIRKTGDVAGEDIGSIMARAELRIERGDYEDALTLLRGTTVAEQEVMAQLLVLMSGRTDAQNAINELISLGLEGKE